MPCFVIERSGIPSLDRSTRELHWRSSVGKSPTLLFQCNSRGLVDIPRGEKGTSSGRCIPNAVYFTATIKAREPTIVSSSSHCSVGNTPSDLIRTPPSTGISQGTDGTRPPPAPPSAVYNFDRSNDCPSSVIETTALPLPLFPSHNSNALAYSSIGISHPHAP